MRNPLDLIRNRRQDYHAAFSGEPGRRVLAELCRIGHVAEPVTIANDPITSAFRDGQRSVALHCLRMLNLTDAEAVALANQKAQTDE